MSLAIEKSQLFQTDVTNQFSWYYGKGGPEVAWRFFAAVDLTILKLARLPDLGALRHFQHPMLQNLRSFGVEPPFGKFLIFYRSDGKTLMVWRLLHGSRDLPRRLAEPSDAS